MKFEEALKELEETVKKLESGETSLEESIELFERGVGLTKECRKLLEGAELKVTQLVDGSEKPFDTENMPRTEEQP